MQSKWKITFTNSERNSLARTMNSTITSQSQLLEPLLTSDGVRPEGFPLDILALNKLDSKLKLLFNPNPAAGGRQIRSCSPPPKERFHHFFFTKYNITYMNTDFWKNFAPSSKTKSPPGHSSVRVILTRPHRRDGRKDAASAHVHWHRACLW